MGDRRWEIGDGRSEIVADAGALAVAATEQSNPRSANLEERTTADAFLKKRVAVVKHAQIATEIAERGEPEGVFKINSQHERLLVGSVTEQVLRDAVVRGARGARGRRPA